MEPEIESETTPLRSRVAVSAEVVQVDFVEPEPEPMEVRRFARTHAPTHPRTHARTT